MFYSVLSEPISERIWEQSGVINVTEITSQDRNLQRTAEQMLDGSVDAVRSVSHDQTFSTN